MMIVRFTVSAMLASVMSLLIFYLIQGLISKASAQPPPQETLPVIVFSEVEIPPEPERKPPKLPPPPEPRQPPPRPSMDMPSDQPPLPEPVVDIDLPQIPGGKDFVNIGPGLPPGAHRNGNGLISLVTVAPPYPPAAALRQIEGWVIVEFTVTATGNVTDPVIIEAQPREVFDQTVLKTIRQWKFKPPQQDDKAHQIRVRQRLDFNLAKG
ncbi:MAG: energy transducer TonB [Wenzhouxiangellaceae bacterium]